MTAEIGPAAYEPNPDEVRAILERRLAGGAPQTQKREQVAATKRFFDAIITAAWAISLRGEGITAVAVHAELPKSRAKNAPNWTVSQVDAVLRSEMGRAALEARGLTLYDEDEGITYEMAATIRALLDPTPGRSHEQRLRVAGVTVAQYQGFLTYAPFRRLLDAGSETALKGGIAQANQKLVQQVEKGDLKAIQYLHELTGYYDKNAKTMLDANAMVQDVLTVVFQTVKDPALLMQIAAGIGAVQKRYELDQELGGGAPVGAEVDMVLELASLGGVPDWSIPAEAAAGLDDTPASGDSVSPEEPVS